MSSSPSEAEMTSRLEKGRALMADAQYAAALSCLMKAVNQCPCAPAAHGKEKSCNISQCTAAVQSSDPDALYNVASGPCRCGFSWPRCTRSVHIEALDTLADCLARTNHYVAAFSTALGIIRLDPASAAGYCRVAHVIRPLSKQYQPFNGALARCLAVILRDAKLPSAAKLRDVIKLFVKAGLHNTQKYRHGTDDLYNAVLHKMAHSLKMPESRRDPMKKFPREVVSMIFSYLDRTALSRCTRVSKAWSRYVVSDKMLWGDIRVERPRNPGRYFGSFLNKHHQYIKSLVIDDVSDFALSESKVKMIATGLLNLERLHIGFGMKQWFPPSASTPSWGEPGRHLTKLTQLSLVNINRMDSRFLLPALLRLAGDFLEQLDLICTSDEYMFVQPIPSRVPKLKQLRLICRETTAILHTNELIENTPNLEQLHLDGLMLNSDRIGQLAPEQTGDWGWPALQSITIGAKTALAGARISNVALRRVLPPLPSSMRKIEIAGVDSPLAYNVLFTVNTYDESTVLAPGGKESHTSPAFPNLEVFRCRSAIPASLLREVVAPAAQSGTLKILELTAEPGTGLRYDVPQPLDPAFAEVDNLAKDWAFAASPSVHTLGIHGFNWATHHLRFDGRPFVDFLGACFPNVETLKVYPGDYPETAALMLELVRRPGIKTIHQKTLRGVEWDEARRLAKLAGVQLHHTVNPFGDIGWPIMK
ncbi:hypothetical protein B0T19DRAFT_187122 [Cercophora scortea]|uniref:F-box domain-containing protein n=1 Tax=Cercophora scortea TaxID=314031 RepID=A0AAE0MDE1_9PEZI|nr:hypothetical protein B0T19DRAFT_187122 [Cercophora scortea]